MRLQFLVLFLLILFSCTKQTKVTVANKEGLLIEYVNPFIGTGGHGHTFPGATMPFGMMQLSPDTRLDGWDGCSGYHYSDSVIYGFSHTHLSGTGVSDYGDVLLMPTNEAIFNNGADGKKGYRDYFSHANEKAEPGYYKVQLDSSNIEVELTVSRRSGMHKYTFPSKDNQIVMLDLKHRDELLAGKINVLNKREINGYRFSKAWATEQKLYFHIKFSKEIKQIEYQNESQPLMAAIEFLNPENEPVYISIGISAVDEKGAKKNVEKEIGGKSFQQVKNLAQESWEKQLEKIVVESDDIDYKTNFYTSLYHTMIAPNLYQDVDGRYRGMDMKIHENRDFEYYTVFSLWDTYRATHPLYTIIEQEKTNDFINTFIAKHEEGGIMPIWDLSANYTGCMIGYHAVPVIADAYLKGIRDYDVLKAYRAMKHSATRDKLGLSSYKEFGFIPVEKESESVSKTLEYAYDDWTIARMADELPRPVDYKTYIMRAQNYKNVFDPKTKFMRGRIGNAWFSPFDPYEVNFNYTEANSWQYSFYVPHDITGFIKILGGKSELESQLDKLFTAENKTSGRDQADITGLIGQYAHGNEPSHHIAYLYNFVNKPHKTQEKVHQILTELYSNEPDGVSGNEDCGQMSAWYVMSSLGFYSVTPGSNQYIIGTPLLNKATFNLENGNKFTIVAEGLSAEYKYIESVTLNGKDYPFSYINHEDIMKGGDMVFNMTNSPSDWGRKDDYIPSTEIDRSFQIVTPPYIAEGSVAFKKTTKVVLANVEEGAAIYYNKGGKYFTKYTMPFFIDEPTKLTVYSEYQGRESVRISTDFYKIDSNISIQLMSEYANQYNAGGDNALIDGRFGAKDFRTGTWQGYFDKDVVAVVDLGKEKTVNSVKMGFLQDQRSWIFYPTQVEFLISKDGKKFKTLGTRVINAAKASEETNIQQVEFEELNLSGRYVKVIAKKLGELPEWHLGFQHGGRSWMFTDEIIIN